MSNAEIYGKLLENMKINQPFVQIAAHKEIHALTKFITKIRGMAGAIQ